MTVVRTPVRWPRSPARAKQREVGAVALVLVIQRARGECRSLWLSPAMCPLKTSRSQEHTGRSEHKSRGSAIGRAVQGGAPGRPPSWEGLRRWRAVVPVLPPIEVFRFPAEVASRSPVGLPRQVFNSDVPELGRQRSRRQPPRGAGGCRMVPQKRIKNGVVRIDDTEGPERVP